MNEKEINQKYQTVYQAIKEKKIGQSIELLEGLISASSNWTLLDSLMQHKTTYQYMLKYMKEGLIDKNHKELFNNIAYNTWLIADRSRLSELDTHSSKPYHEAERTRKASKNSYLDLSNIIIGLQDFYYSVEQNKKNTSDKSYMQQLPFHEECIKQLFTITWINREWSSTDVEKAHELVNSDEILDDDKQLFISAIMISLLECFDHSKASFLLDVYTSSEETMSIRAFTSMVFVIEKHKELLNFSLPFIEKIKKIAAEKNILKDFQAIYRQILVQRDAEELSRKIRDEIMPEMLKKTSILAKDLDESKELDFDTEEEINSLLKDDSSFTERIREMEAMQVDGEDVNLSTFASLKGFPFFRQTHNWFYPFSIYKSEVAEEIGKRSDPFKKNIDFISNIGMFCETDKYSFLFISASMPDSQQGNMIMGLGGDKDFDTNSSEINKILTEKGLKGGRNNVIKLYIQDIYRFVHQYAHGGDTTSIFSNKLTLYQYENISKLFFDKNNLLFISDIYFKKKHWNDYIDIANYILKTFTEKSATASLYKKIGYACQEVGRYYTAIDHYKKSYQLSNNDKWVISRLAMCHRLIGEYRDSLYYCRVIEELDPQSHINTFNIARCLQELGSYDEAIKYYLKYTFIKQEDVNAWRGIAMSSFLNKDYAQAEKYYGMIVESNASADDYINLGNVYLSNMKVAEAISSYKKAVDDGADKDKIYSNFKEYSSQLINESISVEVISTIVDSIFS